MTDFSKLVAALEETLNTTNQTRDFIQIQCDEIRRLLRDWSVPDCGESVELPECTCHNTAVVNEPEEIAKDIEEALDHAKKLRREKILTIQKRKSNNSNCLTKACNIKAVNTTARSVSNNTMTAGKSSGRMVSCNSETVGMKKVFTLKGTVSNIQVPKKKSLGDSFNKPVSTVQNNGRKLPSSVISKRTSGDRAVSKATRYSVPFQTTYQRDFSSRSSKSYKSSQRVGSIPKVYNQNIGSEKCTSVVKLEHSNLNCINHEESSGINSLKIAPSSRTITASDLDTLLNSITINSANSSPGLLTHTTVDNSIRCLLHNSEPRVKVSERIVGLQEAVDIRGVPPDLVKILRSYHRYLGEVQLKETHVEMTKGLLAEKKFIEQLKHSNFNTWTKASSEPLVDLYSDYLSTFVETVNMEKFIEENILDRELAKVQERFESLHSNFLKLSNLDESVIPESVFSKGMPLPRFLTLENNALMKNGRTLAGFWSEGNKDLYKGMTQVQCIRYSSGQQWSAFQENLHKIQHLQLQIQVLEILCCDIVPKLWDLDMNNPTLPSLLKTCSALCNMTALVLPVLIRS